MFICRKKYGAVGDGVTNDAAAFTAMIAAINLRGGKVILQAKSYLINTTVVINKPIWFEGQGMGDSTIANGATRIITTSGSIVVFDVKENHCQFSNLAFYNNSATTPTAGAALGFTGNTRTGSFVWGFNLDKVYISGFYDGILATNGIEWGITGCYFKRPVRYAINIACTSVPDAGDSYINNCEFIPRIGGSVAAIFQQSSGGLKITGCKFNGGTGVKFTNQLYVAINGTTSDLLVSGNSFENFDSTAINISVSGASFSNITITGNQFAGLGAKNNDIKIGGINPVIITGNVFTSITSSISAISSGGSQAILCNTYSGYTTPVAQALGNSVDIQNGSIAITGSTANSATLSIYSGGLGFFASSYPGGFGVPALAGMGAMGPSPTTRGITLFSNASAASGGTGFLDFRGGGYDSTASKVYIDKNGAGFGGNRAPSEAVDITGNLKLSLTGKIKITTGTNASVGTATLVAGTVTVSTTAALTASLIYVTVKTPGGTQGFLSVPTITNATSFVINSTSATETSTVNWWIIN